MRWYALMPRRLSVDIFLKGNGCGGVLRFDRLCADLMHRITHPSNGTRNARDDSVWREHRLR